MFDPKKMVNPISVITDTLLDDLPGIVLSKDRTSVKSLSLINGAYNTTALVDELNSNGDLIRMDREVRYNRINIGEYVAANSISKVDNNGISNYNIITDLVKNTTANPDLIKLSSVFNQQFGLPIQQTDLAMSQWKRIREYDTLFGKVFNTVNCVVTGDTITYTGGNVSVYQRPDTTEFNYNPIVTYRPGAVINRQWSCKEEFEITLPSVDHAESWSLMVESLDSPYAIGNGTLWFEISWNAPSGEWIYKSTSGKLYTFGVESISKIRIRTDGNNFIIDCAALINNNSYETMVTDTELPIVYNGGYQRITLFSSNPTIGSVSVKMKSTVTEAPFEASLQQNINDYDGNQSRVCASENTNALYGRVDKNIVLTNYDTIGFVETNILNKFSGKNVVKVGSISTVDSFSSAFAQSISITNPKFGELIRDGVIKSITASIVNRQNSTVSYTVVYNISEIDGDTIKGNLQTFVNGTLNIDVVKTVTSDLRKFDISVSPNKMSFGVDNSIVAETEFNKYHDIKETDKKFKTTFKIELNEGQSMPSFTVLKNYPSANPL